MMSGQQFLDLEVELRAIPGEASKRTRIGRLYYGVYLEYRQSCEDFLSFDRSRLAREHQVVKSLVSSINPDAADILNSLRIARNRADYDLDTDQALIDVLLEASLASVGIAMSQLADLRSQYEPG